MPRCCSIQENLTAWLDGELPARWKERVDTHLVRCPTCAAEAETLRAAIRWQLHTVAQIAAVGDFDPTPLRMRLERALVTPTDERRIQADHAGGSATWTWWLRPLSIAGAAVAVAIALVFFLAGGRERVLIPLGVTSPPVAVTRQPDLFKEYPLIEDLDALENFDTVDAVPLDDGEAAQRG